MSTPIQKILNSCSGVRKTGEGSWVAKCPGHEDKHPSLSIRLTEDGMVLLKCWSGCLTADVMGGMGMTLADLYDRPSDPGGGRSRRVPDVPWKMICKKYMHGAAVLQAALKTLADGENISQKDRDMLGAVSSNLFEAIEDAVRGTQ